MSKNFGLGMGTLLFVISISLVFYIVWPNNLATATVEKQVSQTPVTTEMPLDHSAHNPVDREVVTATQPITWATVSDTPEQPNEDIDQEEPGAHDMAEMVGGHNMGPVSREGVPAAIETSGGEPLEFREVDGVKEFNLTAERVLWPIMEGVTVTAWTYNGMLPGPMIRVTEGDRVRVVVKNELPDATTIHWHGLLVENSMDGIADITQPAIEPGGVYTYEFTAEPVGSFMYHSHVETDKQIMLGLYAPLIIDPLEPEEDAPDVDVSMMLSEWRVMDGETYPAMPLAGMEPNYFTINGKAFPATETINVKVGDRVRIRLMGIGQFVHPMHLHGFPFKIVGTDGYPVPEAAQLTKDTVLVSPGERYDIEFTADRPGQWLLHCHILHHVTNDGTEPGGLVAIVNVTE
jgi:FtsP/CotA-like multicopper oxidase with cupredoxin domain